MVEHISVFAFHAANPTIPPLHADDDFLLYSYEFIHSMPGQSALTVRDE